MIRSTRSFWVVVALAATIGGEAIAQGWFAPGWPCRPGSITVTSTYSSPARPLAVGDNPFPVGMPARPRFVETARVSTTYPVCFPTPYYRYGWGASYYAPVFPAYTVYPTFVVRPYYYGGWTVRSSYRARRWGWADGNRWTFGGAPAVAEWAASESGEGASLSDGLNLEVRRRRAAEARAFAARVTSSPEFDSLAAGGEPAAVRARAPSTRESMQADVAALVQRAEEALAEDKPRTASHFLRQALVLARPAERPAIEELLRAAQAES